MKGKWRKKVLCFGMALVLAVGLAPGASISGNGMSRVYAAEPESELYINGSPAKASDTGYTYENYKLTCIIHRMNW